MTIGKTKVPMGGGGKEKRVPNGEELSITSVLTLIELLANLQKRQLDEAKIASWCHVIIIKSLG